MKKRQKLLSEEQWQFIEPLLPKPRLRRDKRGRPPAPNRACFEGILWILQTGAAWRFLPDEFPSPSTCWRRLQRWQEEGVWLDAWRALLGGLDEEGLLQWEETFLDGSFAPAKKGGVADEVGAVFVGEQVAAVFVGQDAAGVIDAMQGIEEGLEGGAAANRAGPGGVLQLEADEARHRGALVAIVFIHVEGGDEGRADYRDGQREPEPQQDFGEEGVHSATASSGVRQNW